MPLRGTFRFEKMSGSFKKGETLRFADYKTMQKGRIEGQQLK